MEMINQDEESHVINVFMINGRIEIEMFFYSMYFIVLWLIFYAKQIHSTEVMNEKYVMYYGVVIMVVENVQFS